MQRIKVMVVEDSRVASVMLTRALEAEGFTVVALDDGLDAYKRGLEGDIDLVLLDHLLPGMLGTEVLHRWRSEGITFPVIMISNVTGEEEVTRALTLGARDYVRKPFSTRELMARVRIQLDGVHG